MQKYRTMLLPPSATLPMPMPPTQLLMFYLAYLLSAQARNSPESLYLALSSHEHHALAAEPFAGALDRFCSPLQTSTRSPLNMATSSLVCFIADLRCE